MKCALFVPLAAPNGFAKSHCFKQVSLKLLRPLLKEVESLACFPNLTIISLHSVFGITVQRLHNILQLLKYYKRTNRNMHNAMACDKRLIFILQKIAKSQRFRATQIAENTQLLLRGVCA